MVVLSPAGLVVDPQVKFVEERIQIVDYLAVVFGNASHLQLLC